MKHIDHETASSKKDDHQILIENKHKIEEMFKNGQPILQPLKLDKTIPQQKTETYTNIELITKNTPIEVTPSEVIIRDIEPNQTYEVVLIARNLTNHGRRIRCFQPKTSYFRCDYDLQGSIAAGLAMKLLLSFETNQLGDYHDELEVISDDFKCKVLLHAYMPQANIMFDPSINLGFCQVNKEKIKYISFKNEGKREGKVNLKFEKEEVNLKIEPSEFKIQPQEKQQAKLIYLPKEAGILRGMINVDVQGHSILKSIDISATSVDYFIFIIDEEGDQSTHFDFKNIYFGQSKEIEGYLVNNSPKKFTFKTKFSAGILSLEEQLINFQTPYELGLEQIQKIMYCSPETGTIDSYSQMPIKFICKSAVTDNMIFWTRFFAMTKGNLPDQDHPMITKDFAYTCVFEFEGTNEPAAIMYLEAKGICPTIKISSHMVHFGECDIGDRKDYQLTLENLNPEMAVDFRFTKIAQFNVSPKKGKLNPNQSLEVIISFEPKNMGKFQGIIDLEILNYYKFPIDVLGSSSSSNFEGKTIKLRGIESLPSDYEVDHKFITDENLQMTTQRTKKKTNKIIFSSLNLTKDSLLNSRATDSIDTYDLTYSTKSNREKFTDYLRIQRQNRSKFERSKKLKEKFDIHQEKPEERIPIPGFFSTHDFDQEEGKLIHPYDAEFWFGTNTQVINAPMPKLCEPNDPLHVIKPLGKYEPEYIEQMTHFKPDPDKQMKKIFPSKANSHSEYRFCTMEFNPEQLQKILVGPKLIDFGSVYVKSRISKYFSVKNELKHCIMVQLDIENHDELSGSYIEPQIIPSMQIATFEVAFCSKKLQTFKSPITYTINSKHSFKFLITAEVEPVKLELSKYNLKIMFGDNNLNLEATEVVKVVNNGNATGKFAWIIPNSVKGILIVNPEKGEVPGKSFTNVNITYKPTGNIFKGEGDKLIMKVEDGEDQILYCVGIVNEAKCALKVNSIDLGDVAVNTSVTKYFGIKNTIKSSAVFNINPDLPPYTTVTPMKGKISADQSQDIGITFNSPKEIPVKQDIIINIRGGKELRLGFTANPLLPKVSIKEEEFDFEGVTYGNPAILPLTIMNEGTIPANLEVDLTKKDENKECDGLDCVDFILNEGQGDDGESSIVMSLDDLINDDQDTNKKSQNISDTDEEEGEESEEEKIEQTTRKQFQILVKPKTTLKFNLKFTPKDVKDYEFELPISLKGYKKIDALRRILYCEGLRPILTVEPQNIDFGKKIINSYESRNESNAMNIEISNPSIMSISWKLDIRSQEENQPFVLKPSQGELDPGEKVIIKAYFKPVKQDNYCERVILYLNEVTKPYLELTFKGVGAFPKLTFDRREIILPVVPLDIEAKCTFRIINDGFENLTLRHKLPLEASIIPLEVHFPDGVNLGITKKRLKVDVVFKSKKPLSFTTEIQFIDDGNHSYLIKVSGTADNSLFTNYPYLLRNFGELKVIKEDAKPIRILESEDVDSESSSNKGTSVATSKTESAISKLGKNILGYKPIPMKYLEKSCEFIVRWFKENSFTQIIQKFPNDIIENNGSQIFDLIHFLSGKNLNSMKAKLENITKKYEKVKIIYKQYDDLIKTIKENGALLNTIRPEFLLRLSDYHTYIKMNPNNNVYPKASKINDKNFHYISLDSWITLFYQILKIYYVSRVNQKTFKNLPGIPLDKQGVPDYYIEGSNLYNTSEGLLMRWLEIHSEIIKGIGQGVRLSNFDNDLRNGQHFAAVIQSYVGANYVKSSTQLKQICNNEDDYKYNAEKILKSLEEIGLHSNFIAKDIYIPSQRENILFILFLYYNLPHYIPKSTVEFNCTLGEAVTKNIELRNTTNKNVCYWVKLDAHPDFSIDNDKVRLEGERSWLYPITYTSRISLPVIGRIFFTNNNDGSQRAAALVFDLKSNVIFYTQRVLITARKSRSEIKINSKLYEMKIKEIQVENPFNYDVDYQIILNHEKIELPNLSPDLKKNNKKKKKNQRIHDIMNTVQEEEEDIIPGFFIKREKIQIRKNTTAMLQIQFLPFILETQKCHVVFCDEKVGEVQYTLIGEVVPPHNIEPIYTPPSFYIDTEINYPIIVQFKNPLLEKAKIMHYERLPVISKTKDNIKNNSSNNQKETLTLEIENLCPFIILPNEITLIDNEKKLLLAKGASSDGRDKKKAMLLNNSANLKTIETNAQSLSIESPIKSNANFNTNNNANGALATENKLNVLLNFKSPCKDQEFKFILKNQTKTDIRIYSMKITVLPKPVKGIIEMSSPAGKPITQDIPIFNNSEKDWQFRVDLKNDDPAKSWFSGPSSFSAKRKSKSIYPLTFKPTWCLPATGKLLLTNLSTAEHFDYELKGIGEDPLAVDCLVIKCKARIETFYEIPITNTKDTPMVLTIETDLPNPKGETQFMVAPQKTKNYKFSVTPILSGTYTGSITFYDKDQKYFWYVIELKIENSKSDKPPVDLVTVARKAVAFDISLANPLKEPIVFVVNLNGEGLLGENSLKIPSGKTAKYELLFSPLKPMRSSGSISFINEKLGEAFYEFRLIAEEQPPIKLPVLKCELGKMESYNIKLENPSSKLIKIRYKISNPINFEVSPEEIIIAPYETAEVQINYLPSELDIIESGEVIFDSDEISKWVYYVHGTGILPTKYPEKIIAGALNKDITDTIKFKNPFKEPILVNITLENINKKQNAFELLLKKPKNSIGPAKFIQIPFSFLPKSMNEYQAEIIIALTEKISWRFPLKGITESHSNLMDINLKAKCRVKYEQEIQMTLPGIAEIDQKDTYSLEVINVPKEFKTTLSRWLTITPVKNTLEHPDDLLVFKASFIPMKPIKITLDYTIVKSSGGRWKFKLNLESSEPDPDDTIFLVAPMNKTANISFKLTNAYKQSAEFLANFSPDSDPEFNVMPKTGFLDSYGREGTTFTVSFTPMEYGKLRRGKLIIETDEMYWSYQVKGNLPKFKIPENKITKIQGDANIQGETDMKSPNERTIKKKIIIKNSKKSTIFSPDPKQLYVRSKSRSSSPLSPSYQLKESASAVIIRKKFQEQKERIQRKKRGQNANRIQAKF